MQKFGIRIALLNPGAGLGDHILCLPSLKLIGELYPDADVDLIANRNTAAITQLIDTIRFVPFEMRHPIISVFSLIRLLTGNRYDVVLYVGHSVFIQLLLKCLRIPFRGGYFLGAVSRWLLTASARPGGNRYMAEQHLLITIALLEAMGKNIPKEPSAVPKIRKTGSSFPISRDLQTASKPRILIHPGFSQASQRKGYLKAWPVNSWQLLIQRLLQNYPEASLFLLGGPEDASTVSKIYEVHSKLPASQQERLHNFYGKTVSLQDLAEMIRESDVLITVDSFPMHLGISVQAPTVAIFASTNEKKYLPDIPKAVAVTRQDLGCRPCLWDKRKRACGAPVCLNVEVERVLAGIETLISLPQS